MTRDEVILAIESVDGANEHAVEILGTMLRSRAAGKRRRSLASDIEQAVTCLLMINWPASFFLCRKVRKSIRLNRRLVALTFVLGFILIVEAAILYVIVSQYLDEGYAYAAILYVMLFELSLLIWWAKRYRRRHWVNDLGMYGSCASCRTNLTNEDSVLGETLWVGPEACPKYGYAYPAVG